MKLRNSLHSVLLAVLTASLAASGYAIAEDPTVPPQRAMLGIEEVLPEQEKDALNEAVGFQARVLSMPMPGHPNDRGAKWRHEVLGQVVIVESIALGKMANESPASQCVIYDGGRIYVSGVDFGKHSLSGKLVRVTGTLRESSEQQNQVTKQKFFYLEADKVEPIELANEPWLIAPDLNVSPPADEREGTLVAQEPLRNARLLTPGRNLIGEEEKKYKAVE
ncbi:MAG: hypothetical protein R3C09_28660 [Pirellulaceae bacterium]